MKKWIKRFAWPVGLIVISLGIFLALLIMTLPATPAAAAAPIARGDKPSNETCLACHQNESMGTQFGGQAVSLTIDSGKFSNSVHGQENVACVDCHTNITGFPHPQVF